jgi:hypothetical protein
MVTGNYKYGDSTKTCLEAIWPGIREIDAVNRRDNVDEQWRYANLKDRSCFA